MKQTTMDSGIRVAVSDCSPDSKSTMKLGGLKRGASCSFDDGKSEGVGLC